MVNVDASLLAGRLAARFGFAIEGRLETIDGSACAVMRPRDLPEPNGFAIILSATPRRAEALFRPDEYTVALTRLMSEADLVARDAFHGQVTAAIEGGVDVVVLADGHTVELSKFRDTKWNELEIECSSRINPTGKKDRDNAAREAIERVGTICLALVAALLRFEETGEVPLGERGLPEGAKTTVTVNRYERSPANRAACLSLQGSTCIACGFSFETTYGDLGAGYAEVHHVVPVSQMNGSYRIDPSRDLVPLCANCHAMVHRIEPPMDVKSLRDLIGKQPGASGGVSGNTDVALQRLRRFLDPKIVSEIEKAGPKALQSRRSQLVAIFCDLRNFTSFSQKADPEDVMALLEKYHNAIGPVIRKHEGVLDHFIGDGVLAYVEGKDGVAARVAAALAFEMRDVVAEVVLEKWERDDHNLGFGIGMAQGYATLGTIGFEERFDYTAIGPVINLAARLCDEAKHGQILASGRLLSSLDSLVELEDIGTLEIKGIAGETRIANLKRLSP